MTSRQMPAKCPRCPSLLATTGEAHCKSPSCPWLTCTHCKASIDANAHWIVKKEDDTWETGKTA